MKPITIEEAIKVIEKYSEDDFICLHLRQWLTFDGEAEDNSIELWEYYNDCKSMVKEYLAQKHG